MSQVTLYKHYNAAGWSSLVARKAHNLEAVGSNPSPATFKEDLGKNETMLSKQTTERRWHKVEQAICPCCAIIAAPKGRDNQATVEGMPTLTLF